MVLGTEVGQEEHTLDDISRAVGVILSVAKVSWGRSGVEWESLRLLEEEALANESLHSRRFLGRGVTQRLPSVKSCI